MHSPRQTSFDRGVSGPVADRDRRWLNQLPHAHLVPFPDAAERRREPAPATQGALPHAAVHAAVGWPALSEVSFAEIRRQAQARRAAYLTALVRHILASFKSVPDRVLAPMLERIAGRISSSGKPVWQRPELFGCVALVGLFLAMTGGTTLDSMGRGQCRTEPGVLMFGADLDARMTVSHSSACAIWTKADNASFDELKIMSLPQHGTISVRGRTGVTYRPDRGYTGDDFFAFALRGRSATGEKAPLIRVGVTVR